MKKVLFHTDLEVVNNMNKIDVYWGFVVGMIITSAIFIGLHTTAHNYYPQAIDVYQGKTTLKYTVIDGVVIDSTVVWKSL